MTEVLLEEVGPNGNVQAVVESDGETCFFYLFGAPETELEMKSVWVRNLVAAPASLDRDRMLEGKPPLNPAMHCRQPEGAAAPSPDDLAVVWLPEGDGAALFERDQVVAILPPWCGAGGCHGYASECVGQGPLAWELSPGNALLARISVAREFWRRWQQEEDLWPRAQEALVAGIEAKLGPTSNYYAIDGGSWPPKAMVRIPHPGGTVLVTVGVSLRPQPAVEMYVDDDPSPWKRIELGAVLPASWPEDAIMRFAGYLSAQSTLPWVKYTWLGPGHTIPCDSWVNRDFASAILTYEHPAASALTLGTQFGDPVNLLWFRPITEDERARAIESSGDEVAYSLPHDRWEKA